MSKFLTHLIVEKMEEPTDFERATWLTLAPLVYESDIAKQTITVPAGFLTDFASVPRLALVYALAGDTGHSAATVHDYLCRGKRMPRALADRVFREALEVEGTPAWRRNMMYAGVRIGSLFD